MNKGLWIYESHIFELRLKTWIWSSSWLHERWVMCWKLIDDIEKMWKIIVVFLGAAIPWNAIVDKSDYKSGYVIGCFHHLQGHNLLANRSVMGNDTEGEWWKGSLDSQREIAEEILTCFPSGPLVNSTPLCHRMYKTFCLLPCMLLTQSQSTWHGISHPRWYFHPAIKIIYKWINITAQRACVFQKYLEI